MAAISGGIGPLDAGGPAVPRGGTQSSLIADSAVGAPPDPTDGIETAAVGAAPVADPDGGAFDADGHATAARARPKSASARRAGLTVRAPATRHSPRPR